MKRREFIALLGGAAVWPFPARAQRPGQMPKIGMLWHAGNAEEEAHYFTSLMRGFSDLGYVDGKTALFDHRYADEQYDRFPAMARELVAAKADVIMASILQPRVPPRRSPKPSRSCSSSCRIRWRAGLPTAWPAPAAI